MGAIYEGLLEFQLEPIPPEDDWTVALVTDKGERKASGSYYTPDYIVKYIVEQAVGPVLRAAVEGKQSDSEKRDAVLAVKVLDPAMGSGHFPVEVVEYVARFLVDQGLAPGDGTIEADLAYWKRRVAQSCVYGVDLNPLAVDLAKLSLWLATAAKDKPLSFLDHHLRPGNAVVGAWVSDLRPHLGSPKANRKAKELASQAAAGQLSMLGDDAFRQSMSTAVSSMWLIETGPGNTLAEVKQQEEVYATLRRELAGRYERLANLVTASHFGVEIASKLFNPLAEYAAGRGFARIPQFDPLLDAAEKVATDQRFFHWELEFPEVFFDSHGQHLGERAGFDAVVGNPPYVRQELLSPLKRYLQTEYASFDSVADLYVYFYERGVRLLRRRGRLAYISSGTFARANFAKPFRQYLPGAARLDTIVDFGENQPFPEAEMVRPSIVVLAREKTNGTFRSLFIADKVPPSLEQAVDRNGVDCDASSLALPEWTFQSADDNRLLTKLLKQTRTIETLAGTHVFRGVTTGLNEAFVIDGDTKSRLLSVDPNSRELLRPLVQGQDLRPWYREHVDRWLIFARRGVEIDRYPAIRDHLQKYRADLGPRTDTSDGRGRKPGAYKWYEIQDTVDYYAEFSKPKILWPDISKLPRFSWDETGAFIGNTGYILTGASPALPGILQSRPIWFVISRICTPLRLRAGLWQYRLLPQFMERLPIPELSAEEEAVLGDLALGLTALGQERYGLHERVRHRILADLGKPDRQLNQRLTEWWLLTFSRFREEVRGALAGEIPVREREEWESWLADQRARHEQLTADIVNLEKQVNERAYRLFDLTASEIELIEKSTKYPYGEV